MNLSIIIPVCNEAKTIADCLGSILLQLTRKQEVLLADYGSNDGTMEVVALVGGFAEFHRMNPLPKQAVFCRKTVGAYRIRPHMSKHEITMANKYHHIQLNIVNGGGVFFTHKLYRLAKPLINFAQKPVNK